MHFFLRGSQLSLTEYILVCISLFHGSQRRRGHLYICREWRTPIDSPSDEKHARSSRRQQEQLGIRTIGQGDQSKRSQAGPREATLYQCHRGRGRATCCVRLRSERFINGGPQSPVRRLPLRHNGTSLFYKHIFLINILKIIIRQTCCNGSSSHLQIGDLFSNHSRIEDLFSNHIMYFNSSRNQIA